MKQKKPYRVLVMHVAACNSQRFEHNAIPTTCRGKKRCLTFATLMDEVDAHSSRSRVGTSRRRLTES